VDERLKDRDRGLELRPAAKALLAERGYDPVFGARPLRRTIQRSIEDNLSEKILRHLIVRADHLTVDEMRAADAQKELEVEAKLRAQRAAEGITEMPPEPAERPAPEVEEPEVPIIDAVNAKF
jgi:hypothetical protein